ncbi:MFS superfamily sulfate permease-like transporter [Flavobacterium sp. CG_9.10]|uniref:hypothetical protein n=1 Tax=Flavobacterium sp. CG_9.10 TaxID=2787729 RepID=UPI0018C92AA4|nr:hypothetical protein [Flavobacterium sp. CG_9.10]MBG6111925.1 MFS superfamily sulfate permease-like transporter [Flavobacterium sp. CG_9.10]
MKKVMLKSILAIIILMHGLIHFIGFAKAFNYGRITQISNEISKPIGMFWLLTALLLIATAILFLLKKHCFSIPLISAAILHVLSSIDKIQKKIRFTYKPNKIHQCALFLW